MSKSKKILTKEWLESEGVFVFDKNMLDLLRNVINGENITIQLYDTYIDLETLARIILTLEKEDYCIMHVTNKGKLTKLTPRINITKHSKGIIGECKYCLVGWVARDKSQQTFPLSRLLYAWYHGEARVGYDISHLDGNSLNNKLDNLIEETHKENLARREGAKNQYTKKNIEKNMKK